MERVKNILVLILVIMFLGPLLIVVVPLFLIVAVFFTSGIWLSELVFYRRMAARHRVIRCANLLTRLNEARGTLIVEQFAIGWGYTRLWWTTEDVTGEYPFPLTDSDLTIAAFTEWVMDNYLDPVGGRAVLVCSRNGLKVAKRLLWQYPAVEYVDVWTGGIGWPGAERDEESGEACA